MVFKRLCVFSSLVWDFNVIVVYVTKQTITYLYLLKPTI